MTKQALFFVLILLIFTCPLFAVENVIPAQDLKRPVPRAVIEETQKQKLFISSYDELSWVRQGARKGHWNYFTEQVYYAVTSWFMPYVGTDIWNRFGNRDNIITGGSYFHFPDKSFLRLETGWGAEIDYVYRWQITAEYERPIWKGLAANFMGRYLNYAVNDVGIQSPGLRYYYKDHYLSAAYNISETKSRGPAHWATVKGHFAPHERFNLEVGTAIGERVYDIYELPASKQCGYIVFTRAEFKICKNVTAQIGYGYSQEKPKFIKKDLTMGLTLRF